MPLFTPIIDEQVHRITYFLHAKGITNMLDNLVDILFLNSASRSSSKVFAPSVGNKGAQDSITLNSRYSYEIWIFNFKLFTEL